MPLPLIVALIFTVILLVITAYFFMGSMPLLVLKHGTPLGARFVRGFFNTYYVAAIAAFRRTHVAAILSNFAQLALIVWSLVALPLQ